MTDKPLYIFDLDGTLACCAHDGETPMAHTKECAVAAAIARATEWLKENGHE